MTAEAFKDLIGPVAALLYGERQRMTVRVCPERHYGGQGSGVQEPTNWQAEAERLKAYIRAWLDGDAVTMVRHEIFRADGIPSKHDACEHGQAMWQGVSRAEKRILSGR